MWRWQCFSAVRHYEGLQSAKVGYLWKWWKVFSLEKKNNIKLRSKIIISPAHTLLIHDVWNYSRSCELQQRWKNEHLLQLLCCVLFAAVQVVSSLFWDFYLHVWIFHDDSSRKGRTDGRRATHERWSRCVESWVAGNSADCSAWQGTLINRTNNMWWCASPSLSLHTHFTFLIHILWLYLHRRMVSLCRTNSKIEQQDNNTTDLREKCLIREKSHI